ncbi:hypothetical protein HK105_204088 [Polyrhizophydium stewartii]|uniref:Carboxylesterase type B domain-containing protein n=1 Tax=Polyrhizophydium stewartii TaxID=2732419 RepID=A0ABR4N9Z9_9FUNG
MLFSAVLALASAAAAAPTLDRRTFLPIVNTDAGIIKGKFSSDYTVASFYNIPYAAPPVGNLRFRPPQPPAAFSGVYDATKMGNSCMQGPAPQFNGGVNQNNSEDCLNLNVFVPTEGVVAGDLLNLPVVVYIYGGSFNDGYNNLPIYDGANVIKAQPLFGRSIIVVPNYRTNIFGFATSNELLAEGGVNVGLLDQKAVFEWVRNNIGNFGGDPNKVTAWGESAGAINIATHMVSGDVTKPLFDRAVLESGALFAFANIPLTTQTAFNALATKFNCSAPVLDCLRKVPAEDLRVAAANAGVSYLPAVDGKYVKQQPQVALSKGQIYKIPAIILDNNDEGTYFTTSITTPEALDALQNSFSFLGDAGLAAAKQMYSVANFGSPIAAGANFYGDAVFKCPDRQLAKALTAAGAKVYKGRFSIKPTINLAAGDAFFSAIGVYHTAEMAFVWNYSPLLNQTNYEKSISQKMINTWSDFFAGSPFPGLLTAGINWPTYGSTGKRLVWSSTGTSVETEPADFAARCDFWNTASLGFSTAINGA